MLSSHREKDEKKEENVVVVAENPRVRKKIKLTRADTVFNITVRVVAVLALVISLYPLYFVVIASISSPEAISLGKVVFLPKEINFDAYQFVLKESRIWSGYANTIFYTVFGTVFGTAVVLMAAFALSRKELWGRNVIMKLMVFTMFFSGGLIPTYMVVNGLGLVNTRLVLILLGSVSVYNMIIARTFFQNTLPEELFEAAELDGCGTARFFLQIALPLSKAIVAVIALYVAVSHWNSYFTAMIYTTNTKLYPLQLVLRDILILGQSLTNITDASELEAMAERQRIAQIIKYVVIIVSSAPAIAAYPFLQKYFVQGVMIGSVKG